MAEVKTKSEDVMVDMEGYIRDEHGNLVPDYDMTIISFEDGDVISGEVVKIDRDEVLVDVGYKSEGVIPLSELALGDNVNPHEVISVGEKIDSLVLQKEDSEGRLILSRKRAEYEKAWNSIQEVADRGEIVSGKVIRVVKGGLIIDIGLRGFIPASLIDIKRVKELNSYIGTTVECKILEINRQRNSVVLSRKAILEEEKKEQRHLVINSLKKGKTIKGCISSIVPFGAFVDLDGIDGLIHISEISWEHIEHPSEVFNIGDDVEVQVLDIDRDRQRISLGFKQLQKDPWKEKIEKWKVGDKVNGKISKVVSFGVFVNICDGIEGLVHNSEIVSGNGEKSKNELCDNNDIEVIISGFDFDRRRINLSLERQEQDKEAVESGEEKSTKTKAKSAKQNKTTKKEKVEDKVIKIPTPLKRKKPKEGIDENANLDEDSLESHIAAIKRDLSVKK